MKRIGLRAILDLSQWTPNVARFMANIAQMRAAMGGLGTSTVGMGRMMGSTLGKATNLWNIFLGTLLGFGAAGALDAIATGLANVARNALQAASDFQALEIRFETIAARDYARQFGVSVSDALKRVSGSAKEMIGWVQKIGVSTPFTNEAIARAFTLANAYGLNVSQAKRLTLAVADWAAAFGLGNDEMDRAVYALGQIISLGRASGQELMQLSNAFFPVARLIEKMAEDAGVSFGEMREQISKGMVSSAEFVEEFIKLAESDFPGAAKRMSRTLMGVKSNIEDFFHAVVGFRLLGPIMGEVSGLMADALERMMSEENITKFELIGQALRENFLLISGAVRDSLLPALQQFFAILGIGLPTADSFAAAIIAMGYAGKYLVQGMSAAIRWVGDFIRGLSGLFRFFPELAGRMYGWGANVITSFARGMAAAVQAIVNVIRAIANIISGWLKPGSPPRILPDLDNWGRDAMNVYLSGWKSADWSIFEDISDIMEGFIRTMQDRGLGETDIIPRILGTREAIAQAIEQMRALGSASREAIDSILNSAGIDNQPLRDYIAALYDAERASLAVKAAQENLNQVTDQWDAALEALEAQLRALNEQEEDSGRLKDIDQALSRKILTDEERERLELEKKKILLQRQINQTRADRDIAVDAAREKLEAAQRQEEIAREQLAISQSQVEATLENNRLIQEQIQLLKRLAEEKKAGGEGAGAIEPPNIDFPGIDDTLGGFEDLVKARLENIKKAVEAKFQEIFAAFRKRWEEFRGWWDSTIVPLWRNATNTLALVWGRLREVWETDIAPRIKNSWNGLSTFFTGTVLPFWETIWNRVKELGGDWPAHWERIGASVKAAWETIKEDLGAIWDDIKSIFADTWNEIKLSWQDMMKDINPDDIGKLYRDVGRIILWFMEIVSHLIAILAVGLVGAIRGAVSWLKEFKRVMDDTSAGIRDGIERIKKGDWSGILEIVGATFTRMLTLVTAPITLLAAIIAGFVDSVIRFFRRLYNELVGASIIPDLMNRMVQIFSQGMAEILKRVVQFVTDIPKKIAEKAGEWYNSARETFQKIWEGFDSVIKNIVGTLVPVNLLNKVRDLLFGRRGEYNTTGYNLFDQVRLGFNSVINTIVTSLVPSALLNRVRDQINGRRGEYNGAGLGLMGEVRRGFESVISTIINATIPSQLLGAVRGLLVGSYGGFYNAALAGFNGVVTGAASRMQAVVSTVASKIAEAMSAINGLWSAFQNIVANIASTVIRVPTINIPGGGGAPAAPRPPTSNTITRPPTIPRPGTTAPPPRYCFVAGTPVLTPDGYRPIESIKCGDRVMLLDDNHTLHPTIVAHLLRNRRDDLVQLTLDDGMVITCSPNHRFKTVGGWVQASKLFTGCGLVGVSGVVRVVTVLPGDGQMHEVYNFEVQHPDHTYIVGDVVVHNAKAYAFGANLLIPPGFYRDNFPAMLSSGERLMVIPKGIQSMLNANPAIIGPYLSSLYKSVGKNVYAGFTAISGRHASGPMIINNYRTVQVQMSPHYQNVQSPSSVYFDMTAALHTVGI